MSSENSIYDSKHLLNAVILGKDNKESTMDYLVQPGATEVLYSGFFGIDNHPPIKLPCDASLGFSMQMEKEPSGLLRKIEELNALLQHIIRDNSLMREELRLLKEKFLFFSSSVKSENFVKNEDKLVVKRPKVVINLPKKNFEGKIEEKAKKPTLADELMKNMENKVVCNVFAVKNSKLTRKESNGTAKHIPIINNYKKIKMIEKNERLLKGSLMKKPIKKLSQGVMDMIWNTNDFKFEGTKYKTVKIQGIPGMRVSTLKSLLNSKLPELKPSFYGALQFNSTKNYWMCLMNESIIAKLDLLNHSKFALFTVNELKEEKALVEKVIKMNNNELKIKNRPLSIALKLLKKGIDENDEIMISSVCTTNLVHAHDLVEAKSCGEKTRNVAEDL